MQSSIYKWRKRMNKKAIVLLSGGQDSTTSLFWAKQNFDYVEAIGFDYGQKHGIELQKAKEIAEEAKVEYKVYSIKGLLSGSSLIEGGSHNESSSINPELPSSFVAGRNLLFITIAASYGIQRGIADIVTGVCETDYSGYPDCRQETISSLEETLRLGMDRHEIKIHTPLMYLSKAETWKLSKDLGCLEIIVNKTITDYNGDMTPNDWGFGKLDNPSSILRANGYYKAKDNGWI